MNYLRVVILILLFPDDTRGQHYIPDSLFGTNSMTLVDSFYTTCGISDDAGNFYLGGTSTPNKIIVTKFLSNGELDSTFGTGGIFSYTMGSISFILGIAIQPDGKIIFVGGIKRLQKSYDGILGRLTTNGEPDPTFGSKGFVYFDLSNGEDYFNNVVIQSNGKIVVAGEAENTGKKGVVLRYNSNGSPDKMFANNGLFCHSDTSYFETLIIDSANRIVAGGSFKNDYFYIIRLTPNGILDQTFGTNGVYIDTSNKYCRITELLEDGNGYIAAGYYFAYIMISKLFRVNYQGELDITAFGGGIADLPVAMQSICTNHLIRQESTDTLILAGFDGVTHPMFLTHGFISKISITTGQINPQFGENGFIKFQINNYTSFNFISQQTDKSFIVGGNSNPGQKTFLKKYTIEGFVSAPDEMSSHTFSIYPNPSSGSFYINPGENQNPYDIEIYSITGTLSERRSLTGLNYFESTSLANGVYIMLIRQNGVISYERLVINR